MAQTQKTPPSLSAICKNCGFTYGYHGARTLDCPNLQGRFEPLIEAKHD